MSLKDNIYLFFNTGHKRTITAKRNIIFSFFLKGLSLLTGFWLISLTIKYINTSQYGIWLTLSSIMSWMSFFDIGLSNGLRNKLTETNAIKEYNRSKMYVSTTYALIFIVAALLFLIFFTINRFFDWNKILNMESDVETFSKMALLVFGLFCLQFVFQIINTILTACHKVAKVSLLLLISQVVTLIAVFMLIQFTKGSLYLLVLVTGGVPVIVQFVASIWYFKTDLHLFAPGIKYIDFKYARELLNIGGFFFIIQIGALVLFQTDNIVITQLFGPAEVTTFNIAYKLFSVFIIGFNIIITPFWTAFTEAYTINDLLWIKRMMTKLNYLFLLILVGSVILFFAAPYIYHLWLNSAVNVPVSLSLAMAIYVIVYTWQTLHVYLLNGINKIRLQLCLVVFSAIVNIPLAIFFGHRIGLAGVTLSNAVLFFVMGIVFSYQSKSILNQTAKGILNA